MSCEEVKEEFEPEEVKVDFDKEKELEELPELHDIEMEKAPSHVATQVDR